MSNKFNPSPRTYFKRNFKDLLDIVTPDIYKVDDISLSGEGVDDVDKIINTHLNLANTINSILSISSISNSQSSNLNNISGISQYFVKQNNLTNISPLSFEKNIMIPLGTSISNYETSSEFFNYLSGTFLPKIQLATETDSSVIENNLGTLSALTSENTASSVHNHLVDTLGWFYFLNTSANGSLDWEPSGYVASSLAKLYTGTKLGTLEGIIGLTKYLWNNYETCSTFNGLIPSNFVSGSADAILDASDGIKATYTSGTQKLDNLETLLEVIYSPYYIDQQDYRVKDAFEDFINLGISITDKKIQGPFTKFQEAMGYSMADITEQIENIGLIYDINDVDEDYLKHIAELIGWRLKGSSPSKWRHQLRNAVDIYKRKGTLESIQVAINTLITDTILDVSGRVQELWESYVPYLIWYTLGTESGYFKSLKTWTQDKAIKSGVFVYDPSSLENNLKIVTDVILLRAAIQFPNSFIFDNKTWPINKLIKINSSDGTEGPLYTVPYQPGFKNFYVLKKTDPGYDVIKNIAYARGEIAAWENSYSVGPLGEGHYFEGLDFDPEEDLKYLKSIGDPTFVFNFRNHKNFPIPPFEEVKYYQDCSLTPAIIEFLIGELECFGVSESFLSSLKTFLLNAIGKSDTDLNALNNEFLFFFSGVQIPPNYDSVVSSIGTYISNLLPLWNGKSSHLFIDFEEIDFSFGTTTIAGDGKYILQNTSQIAKEFSPAHAIVKSNYTLSAGDSYDYSSTFSEYVMLRPKEVGYVDIHASSNVGTNNRYSKDAVITGYEVSGSNVFEKNGRGGLPTFKRSQADDAKDSPFFSSVDALGLPSVEVPRTNVRRRNYRGIFPLEGYYDRTGFNGPVTFDPSVLENSNASSLNVLTLGYVPSAGGFYPVEDPINPSGVWHYCENLNSSRSFFDVDTSNTFPFRGLSVIGSDAKVPEIPSSVDNYVDRGQPSKVITTIHRIFERTARRYAENYLESFDASSAILTDKNWKNIIQSEANRFISSGLTLNSFDDYQNFSFGSDLHRLYKNYCDQFEQHATNDLDETGASVIAHVFSKGLYNCDFDIAGSASVTTEGNYIASSLTSEVPIFKNNGSGVFSVCSVENGYASGTYVASSNGETVVPLSKPFFEGSSFHAEFRNPYILSGIEFVDTSGAPDGNKFSIFKLDNSLAVINKENYLVGNTVIKCKTGGGLPRIRFDLSSYGERLDKNGNTTSARNYFVHDHDFELRLNGLIGDEAKNELGGGSIGFWIHTEPVNGMFWSWTPNKKWEMSKESELNSYKVKNELAHIINLDIEIIPDNCLKDSLEPVTSNTSIKNLSSSYLKTISIPFNTRNYTKFNNYQSVLSVPEEFYKHKQLVHDKDTNYIVEVFFLKPTVDTKYLFIDSFELQDTTLRDYAGVPLGFGIETSSRPLMPFVKEDKVEFEKEELYEILKFFNGISVQNKSASTNTKYYNSIPSRTPSVDSEFLEASGGSRLNYRLSPYWHTHEKNALDDDPSYATNYSLQVSSVTFIN